MRVKETTRREIEERFAKMGDYVKMDYLLSCLKNPIDFDTRKFVLVKLAGLFEARKMFSDAGKAMRSAADINTSAQNKINDFIKSAEIYILGGHYDEADVSMKKAVSFSDDKQKKEVRNRIKEFYKAQARSLMKTDKKRRAADIYEKVLSFELDGIEREEIKDELLGLYRNFGMMVEYKGLAGK